MWDYAIKNGYIKDIDKYLIQITERQDFSLNMTKMSDKEMKDEVLKWLKKLNKKFGKLKESELIKTGVKIQKNKIKLENFLLKKKLILTKQPMTL